MIDIKGMNKADVLAKLYNASHPLGLGILCASGKVMTTEEAQAILDSRQTTYFDYLMGRIMKVDLSGDELNPGLYDRDNGHGAAASALGR